jgi:hypothetical protein
MSLRFPTAEDTGSCMYCHRLCKRTCRVEHATVHGSEHADIVSSSRPVAAVDEL